MKKLIAAILISVMVLSYTACGIPEKPDNMRQEFYDIVEATLNDIELCLDEEVEIYQVEGFKQSIIDDLEFQS